ncbi:MAG: phosphoribosylanthranilate isomerase [Planctomycetes bacterium]|nr:phosphoribosylanthranilate isomerase [Planctomycetota bacterium]
MVRVKICGITNPTDARLAVRYGAHALGFNFSTGPRIITKDRARAIVASLPPFVTPVGLFVNETVRTVWSICDACGIDTVQLHGDERPTYIGDLRPLKIIKAFRIDKRSDLKPLSRYDVDGYLLDARVPGQRGGTGKTFDWTIAADAHRYGPIILAGGLNPDNVAGAIRIARPFAVDVCSGVEAGPGQKDKAKLVSFLSAVQTAGV